MTYSGFVLFTCLILHHNNRSSNLKLIRSCLMAHHKTNANPEECGKHEEDTDPKDVRDRVLQEIGCTSTTFIGPTGRPKTTGPTGCPKTIGPTGRLKTTGPTGCPKTIGPTGRLKPIGPTGRPKHRQETQPDTPNIEDTLSEFYKELEKIDSTDNTDVGNQTVADSKSCKPLETSAEKVSVLTKSLDTGFYQNSMRRPVRPHWYQNEPYPLRDQRSSVDQMSGGPAHLSYAQNHWHHRPPPQNRLPFPRFHNPPFCGPPPPHFSPPFPGPPPPGMPPPPPHMNDNWNCSDKVNRQQDMCWLPPHDEYNRLPQDSNEDFPHHFDRNEWGHSDDSDSLYSVSHRREDFDNHRKFGADKELHEKEDPRQPSDQTLILILLRGGPGSGKSTLATELLSTGPSGVALSTDDYFFNEDGYIYDRSQLGVAHEWNQSRAKEAMLDGRSPIIIDNTNIEAWEMKPYVKLALEKGYRIDFLEPDTCWKFDPFELEKRNKHGVPQQKIAQMLDRFSFPISVDIVMNSQEPPHVSMRHRPEPQKEGRFNSPNYNQQIHPNK